MKKEYLFTSDRLGFRNWTVDDTEAFAQINADADVMQYFPKPLTYKETEDFVERLMNHFQKHGFNYFATEILESGELIGFIGLAYQSYESDYTPAVDIGWRLKKSAWGKGFATEGAKRCLKFAFESLELEQLISTCTLMNHPSEKVMQKIGMQKAGLFKHPRLKDYPELENCICYKISKHEWLENEPNFSE